MREKNIHGQGRIDDDDGTVRPCRAVPRFVRRTLVPMGMSLGEPSIKPHSPGCLIFASSPPQMPHRHLIPMSISPPRSWTTKEQ